VCKARCLAVVMGDKSGADSRHEFEVAGELMDMPVNDVVDSLMDHLREVGLLRDAYDDELNSAIRNVDHRVVPAIGTFRRSAGRLPFAAFISKA
jgi:hypothetical protein